jgi:hypothetical protein
MVRQSGRIGTRTEVDRDRICDRWIVIFRDVRRLSCELRDQEIAHFLHRALRRIRVIFELAQIPTVRRREIAARALRARDAATGLRILFLPMPQNPPPQYYQIFATALPAR